MALYDYYMVMLRLIFNLQQIVFNLEAYEKVGYVSATKHKERYYSKNILIINL